jgi:hypothetical protein
MNNELKDRLEVLHGKLAEASQNKDAPFSLDLDELQDIVEFMDIFLYN